MDIEQTQTDNPGVIIRPPMLYLGVLAIGIGLSAIWPLYEIPSLVRWLLGPIFVVFGFAVLMGAMRLFGKAGTNVPTNMPTQAIVTSGLYAFSRNPIYIAVSVIYVGIAVMAASLWALLLLGPVLVVMTFGVIMREERYLVAKFGNEYLAYKAQTRRWL